ncbi:F-box only protein 43 [Chelonia mydas]|uniref:F-box only protein 43 n=1 Tax=Chelonia mydas TaxID=8469 RepID=M7ATW1_CHEMY|nr:F-box only protein 43 [Chelonia mydas]
MVPAASRSGAVWGQGRHAGSLPWSTPQPPRSRFSFAPAFALLWNAVPQSSNTAGVRIRERFASPGSHIASQSWQRTSTVDDSKCKNNFLSEPECLSPIHHNTSKDTIIDKTPNELSDSSLTSINDESTSLELLRTPTCCMLSETNEDKFLTPVSNLTADFNFYLLDINTPPTHVVSDLELSVPEDSGFNSLGLDKSEDSSSDHEGSFQEVLQKQKEVSKLLDAKRKSRKLDRVRRLSTLRERGSQSETEEDYDITLINSEYKLKIARDSASEDSGLVFKEENSGDLVLNLGDLSRTPALQVVREIFLRSKRKRPEQNGLLENTERAEMSVLEYILAGLIGKKMGLEKLDILTELKYRDLKHILAIVLGALTVESLCSIWKVSKNWREIVIQDKNAYLRRKLYIKQLKAEAGGCLLHVEDAATRLNILSRSALRPVQAQAKTAVLQTPPYCNELLTPTGCSSVPQSTSKQEEYLKIAKTLFIDEALKPCPRYEMPKYLKKISKGMMDRGYNRDPQQCHMEHKELRQVYQKTTEANTHSGSEPQTCRFYDELHAILGGAPITIPHLYVESCKEVSHNRDEDFGDEEDDSAHETSGETVLPDSQELFITLEPIRSQGWLPDHEAGEGASAIMESVTSRGLSDIFCFSPAAAGLGGTPRSTQTLALELQAAAGGPLQLPGTTGPGGNLQLQ